MSQDPTIDGLKRPTLEDARRLLDDHRSWHGRCHEISIALVRSGFVRGRVARGFCRGISSQHSWIVLDLAPCSPYNPKAIILDPTLHAFVDDVEGLWWGTLEDGRHNPHGGGSIWDHGCPIAGGGPEIAIEVPRSVESFLNVARMLEPVLDVVWWSTLLSGPLGGIPELPELIEAASAHPELAAHVPIDILGMCTNVNPSGLYLRADDGAEPPEELDAEDVARCVHCGGVVTDAEDVFCHGCKSYICEDCEVNHTLMGPHDPDDHLCEPDFEDEEDEL